MRSEGNSDDSGSTWLTAFVVRSFAQARPYIFIDEDDFTKSVDWFKRIQKENGCFKQVEKKRKCMGSSTLLCHTTLTKFSRKWVTISHQHHVNITPTSILYHALSLHTGFKFSPTGQNCSKRPWHSCYQREKIQSYLDFVEAFFLNFLGGVQTLEIIACLWFGIIGAIWEVYLSGVHYNREESRNNNIMIGFVRITQFKDVVTIAMTWKLGNCF